MSNSDFMSIVAHTLLRHGTTIYGGYVRDILSNRIPSDIDVCLGKVSLHELLLDFARDGLVVNVVHPSTIDYSMSHRFLRFKVQDDIGNSTVQVDIVEKLECLLDFNINGFLLTESGISHRVPKEMLFALDNLQSHIALQTYDLDKMPTNLKAYRVSKIKAKGFEPKWIR